MAPEKAVEQFFQIPNLVALSVWSKIKEIFVLKNYKNTENSEIKEKKRDDSENGNLIKKEDPKSQGIRSNRRPPLSNRLSEALVKRHLEGRKVPKNFNSIVLKFPKIDRALLQVKKAFYKVDSSLSGSLSLPQLSLALSSLSLRVSPSEARDICHEADIDHSGAIGLREFFLAVAFVVLLEGEEGGAGGEEGEERDEEKEKEKEKGPKVGISSLGKAFEMIFDAFFFFDENKDGVLSKDEVSKRFGDSLSCEKEGTTLQSFTHRFDEMDYDHNGECTFTEFVYAFVGWVGTAEDEEEDEEEGEVKETVPEK